METVLMGIYGVKGPGFRVFRVTDNLDPKPLIPKP